MWGEVGGYRDTDAGLYGHEGSKGGVDERMVSANGGGSTEDRCEMGG